MFTHQGTLKNGRHYILALDKWFEAGEETPLTEADVEAFGDKFDAIKPLSEAVVIETETPDNSAGKDNSAKETASKGKSSTGKK